MGYLQERSVYEARYDRLTVDHFRRVEKLWNSELEKYRGAPDRQSATKIAYELSLYFRRGEWWERKRGTIEEWMQRDRVFDQIASQTPFAPVRCDTCHAAMEPQTKAPQLNYDHPADSRMMYLYRCPNNDHRGKAIYTDGQEKLFEPTRCDVCGTTDIVETRSKDQEELISTCEGE